MTRTRVPTVVIDQRWTALRIRQALQPEVRAGWVKVYDAQGVLIAEVDPVTKRRIPLNARSLNNAARRGPVRKGDTR